MLRPILLGLPLAFVVAGCKPTNIKAYEAGDNISAHSEGEERLWHQAQKLDTALSKSRQTFKSPELKAYLQDIMDKLFPEFAGKIRVEIHRAPVLNAFALPNGSVYINLGMLASLENEAQIATVLAHEGIHFLQKHSAKQRIHAQNSQGWGLAVTALGIPLFGQLVAMSAMSGYSVEHETEADILGYERLRKAGYATSEAPRTFEILARETKANKIEEPYFFASHPQLKLRIENFNRLNAEQGVSEGRLGFEDYQHQLEPFRGKILQEKLADGKHAAVIATLEDPESKQLYPRYREYYLAQAFLKEGSEESKLKALPMLQQVAKDIPDFADVHKDLGYYYMKRKKNALAADHLQKFIALADSDLDTSFEQHYLDKLK